MTNTFPAKKRVQLTVDLAGPQWVEKAEDVKAMLVLLSGLNVKSKGFLGRKFNAYFDDINSALVAESAVDCIICCEAKIRKGSFNVKKLARDNNVMTAKESQVFKTRLAKDAKSTIDLLHRSRLKQQ